MKFKVTQTDYNFQVLKMISNERRWELGLTQMQFGVRVRFARAHNVYCLLDYCAGADQVFQMELLYAIRTILLDVPESTCDNDIMAIFPRYLIRPINLDPTCWIRIQELRDKTLIKFNEIKC